MMMASIFTAEWRRMVQLWWSYRLNALSSLLLYAVVFPVLTVMLQNLAGQNGAAYGPTEQALSLIGFLVWHLCMKLFNAIPDMVTEEADVGTLENVMLAAAAPGVVVGLRILVLGLRYLLETAVLSVVVMLLLSLYLLLTPLALLVLLLTVLGTCGVGMAIGGLALIHKSVSSIASVVALLSLLISGALVPINGLPIFNLLKLVFPTTWGIDLLRQVLLARGSVLLPDLIGLLLQTVLFCALGIAVWRYGLAKARMRGDLAAY